MAEEKGEEREGVEKKKKGADGFGGEATSPFIKVSNAKCVAAERCFEARDRRGSLINPPRFGSPSRKRKGKRRFDF